MKIFLLITALLLPAYASANIPAFPMAFWGSVTVDATTAPYGATIRIYSNGEEVGEATVESAGIYGYTDPTKQKLIVSEGNGTLMFTIQASGINGGLETGGISAVTHPEFVSGETIHKDLAFTLTSNSGSEVTPPSSGGGGGGGGTKKKTVSNPIVLGASTTLSTTTPMTESELKILLEQQLVNLLIQLVTLLQEKLFELQRT